MEAFVCWSVHKSIHSDTPERAQVEARKGAVAPGFMYEFPWECIGNYKYALYAPFVYVVATGQDDADMWCYHMCGIISLRYMQVCLFHFFCPFPWPHLAYI